MAVNKVVINDEVVLDLTGDTVQAADLPKGVIAHSATGAKVTGTTNYAGSSNAGGAATSANKVNAALTMQNFFIFREKQQWADVYCSLSWKYKNVSQGILARDIFNGRRSHRKAKTLQYVKDSQQEYEARRSSQKVSV